METGFKNIDFLFILAALMLVSSIAFGQSDVQDFTRDWRFAKGEQTKAR